jgi:hypothetical protein
MAKIGMAQAWAALHYKALPSQRIFTPMAGAAIGEARA